MANRIRFKVDGGPTSTSAVTQIILGSFDVTAVPGYGTLAGLTRWSGVIRSRVVAMHNGGDHGTKVWEFATGVSANSSAGLVVGTTANAGNAAASGVLLSNGATQPSGTFAFDVNGNNVRFLVTPANTVSMIWMATHDVELLSSS
jgi:hypothetical protein